MMLEQIMESLGASAWGIISLAIEVGLCGFASGLAYLSLKLLPPKDRR